MMINASESPGGADFNRRVEDPGFKPPLPSAGFTLIEMLTVVAVIGILAMLAIPSVTAARHSSSKARTRVQFAQWAVAIESFRMEYGYYPAFDGSNLVNGGATSTDHLFHDILAAKKRDGSALASGGTAAQQNRRLISYFSFNEADLTSDGLIRDAFENTTIAVLVDKDLDGVIRSGSDFSSLPAVGGLTPTSADFPASGIRAGVIFYAPDPHATVSKPGFIFSWR